MAEATLAGRSPWCWFHLRRDDGDGRDDDSGGGQKTVTIVTTVTEFPKMTSFNTTSVYYNDRKINEREAQKW